MATLKMMENGPYLLNGPLTIQYPDGSTEEHEKEVVALCRCGESDKKPMCDGSHAECGFKG